MSWWLILIITYCTLTYVLGVYIGFLYLIGNFMAIGSQRVKLKSLWWGICIYTLISPIFVPWWIVEFVRANKGG